MAASVNSRDNPIQSQPVKRKRARASRQVSSPKDLVMLSGTLTLFIHQEYAISNATKRSRHATVAIKIGSNAMAMTSRARRVWSIMKDIQSITRYNLSSPNTNCSAATAIKHERSVILHYNMAIRHLQPLLSKATPEDAEAALACCILFICLENIRGRYAESLKHLESGVGLLVSLLVPDTKRRSLTSRKGRLPVALHQAISSTGQNKRNIDHIAVLFSRLSLETHLLTDSEVVPLITISRATPDLGQLELQSLKPIMTLDAARGELHSFEIAHDMFYQQAYSNIKSRPSHGDMLPNQPPEYLLNLFSCDEKVAYQQIYQQFWQWSARFDQFILERASLPRSSKDLSDASKIRLLQKTWTAMLDKEPWTFSGQDFPAIGVLDEFLPEVESIIKLRGPSSRPLITFGADIVPYITIAGYLTDDLGLLQRVISALKLLDTREGFWDSKDIAEIFEASIIAHADLGLDIRHNSKGILHLAKILSEMNIQCISPNNSIALLARNIEP
ncbi:hypothetical protein BHYA_0240g00110 [Botrytis hyacinthi]|uniref:Uncharacterized protein n=1 Tax=Botrytis hyacinthi TaxID=278943 RepID=A0A4Z1GDT0_9HELO|nr:hypothetical protein BHYA_0240g00110 [Botrytis hyacinthi]